MSKSVAKKRANKRASGWLQDPAGMRSRILAAATREFARHGFGGARIDRIADLAGANKRMVYYHIGDKEALYLAVLEAAYAQIRQAERELNLEALGPKEAILKLLTFTWEYYLQHPEFLALLNEENQMGANFLRNSRRIREMHSPFVALISDILKRGAASGELRAGIDPIELYISIAGLCYFYQSNSATLSIVFGRDLLSRGAKARRLAHMTVFLLAALRPA